MSQLETQLATAKEELKLRNAELAKERMTGDLARKELASLKEDKAELEAVLKGRGEELLELKKTAGQSSADKMRTEEQLANVRLEFEKFKKGNLQTLRLLLEEVSRQTLSVDRLLECLVDYETSSLQVEILKSVRAMAESHGSSSSSLSQQVQALQRELAADRARAADRQAELEHAITMKEEEYAYFKQAMQLDKDSLEEALGVQNDRLDQIAQDLAETTAHKERLEELYKKQVLESEETAARLEHTSRQLQDAQAELSGLGTELEIERREKEEVRARLEAERHETERRLQGTEKELQARLYKLEHDLAQQAARGDELLAQLRTARQESDGKSSALRSLEDKVAALEGELHDRGLDLASGQKREKDLCERVRQLEDSLLAEEAEVAKGRMALKELQEKLRELEAGIRAADKDKNSLLKKIEVYEEELRGRDESIGGLSQQALEQQEECDQLRLLLAQLETTKASVSEEGAAKSRQIQDLARQLEQMKDRFLRQEKEITQKADEILSLRDANEKALLRLSTSAEELQTSLQLAESSLRKEQQAKEKLQKDTEAIILEQQTVREQLESEITQLNEEVFHHSSEVNTLRLKEEEDAEHIRNLQADCETLQGMLAEANAQLEHKEMYINVEVSNREKDYYDMKKKLEERLAQLEAELATQRELARAQEETIADTRRRHEDDTAKLRDALRALGDEKRSNEGQNSALLAELEFNNERLQADLEGVQQAAHKAEEEFAQREAELIGQLEHLRTQAETHEKDLNATLQKRLDEINRLNEDLNQKEGELFIAKEAVSKEKQTATQVQKQFEDKEKQYKKTIDELKARFEDTLRHES